MNGCAKPRRVDAQSELLYVQSELIYGCNCYTLTHTVYMLLHARVSEGESEDVKKDQAITPAPQKTMAEKV